MFRRHVSDLGLALLLGMLAATAVFTDTVLRGRSLVPSAALREDPVFQKYWHERFDPRAAWDPSGVFIHYPVQRQIVRELRAGRAPLWNPYAGAGMPIVAEVHHGPFSPFLLPVLASPSETSWSWFLLSRVIVAAAGAFLFVRSRGQSRTAGAFVSIAFALTGCAMLRFDLPTEGTAYAMLPICAMAATAAARNGGAWIGVMALAIGALVYSAHPELTALAALGAVVIALAEQPATPRAWLRVAAGGLLGVLIGSAVVFPFLEFLFGDVATYKTDAASANHLLADVSYLPQWPDLLRFGSPVVALGAIAALAPSESPALGALRRAFAALLTISVGLFVVQRFVSPVVFAAVPPPRYSVFLVAFTGAVLAGAGLDALLAGRVAARDLFRGAGVAVAWMLVAELFTHRTFLAQPDVLVGEVGGVAALFVAWALVDRGRARAAAIVVVVAASLALVVSGRRLVATLGHGLPESPAVVAMQRLAPPPARIAGVGTNFRRTPLAPELATFYQLGDVRAFAALFPARYRSYMSLVDGVRLEHVIVLLDSVSSPLIDLLGVTHAFVAPDDVPAGWRVVWTDGNVSIVENPHPVARAFVPAQLVSAEGALGSREELARLAGAGLLPGTAVVEAPAAVLSPLEGGDADARITEYASDRVVLKVHARSAALVVLTDTWLAGWIATIDDAPTKIYPTDHLFRGVAVAAGDHTVIFYYRPRGWRLGLRTAGGAGLLALLIILAGSYYTARQRGRRISAPWNHDAPPETP